MVKSLLASTLLTLAVATVAVFPASTHAAPRINIVTECVPFQPYPGTTHQMCTRYIYDDNGVLVNTMVYYIDESGMWYLLP